MKHIPILLISLFVCLFIYVFFRTEQTLVNQVFIAVFSRDTYLDLKQAVTSFLPLNDYLVYSIPEGLWVFCITVTSSIFYIKLFNRRWSLVFLPIFLAVTMELFQLFHFTNGYFDWIDILFSLGFWILAVIYTRRSFCQTSLFQSCNINSVSCILSYAIVFLAHVQ